MMEQGNRRQLTSTKLELIIDKAPLAMYATDVTVTVTLRWSRDPSHRELYNKSRWHLLHC